MNNEISYFTGNETLIDDIEELWIQLNQVHFEKSLDFKYRYKDFTFRQRKQSFFSRAGKGELFIVIAYDRDKKIGYCVSSIVDNIGEIDSIYVEPN
jgi:hypothetical protein